MAWTAPATAVAGTTLTAAWLNTYLRDNMLETAPGLATTAGGIFVATGTNAVAERIPESGFVTTAESTTSTSYVNLATTGPTVTVTTGTKAIALLRSGIRNSGANYTFMSIAVSGATTIAADDEWAIYANTATDRTTGTQITYGLTGSPAGALTAGSNTFTPKYRTVAGTAYYDNRELTVIPL